MKQTDQYGLNQWDLSDRIRMEDFNADNFKIAAALAGLSGQMAGMASAADMDKLKTSLQNEDKRIWRSMPGPTTFWTSRSIPFTTITSSS